MHKALDAAPPLWTAEGVDFLWDYLSRHQDHQGRGQADPRALEFLARCLAGFTRSKAQRFQDLYVLFRLGDKRGGYFVEFGATDGLALSNTFLLEREFGWTGVLAEPMPGWHQALQANRSARIDHRCVWRRSGETLELLGVEARPELSTIKTYAAGDHHRDDRAAGGKTFRVETVSLTDLLAQHGAPAVVDYLSIDVEGAELDVLEGFDFERFQPRVITIEHAYIEERRNNIALLLGSQGFERELEAFSGFDDWYFHPQRV